MIRARTVVCLAATLWLAGAAAAQPPAPAPAPAAPQRGAAPNAPAPPAAPYTYNPEGRRDPFVSLVGRGSADGRTAGNRPPGLPGLLINEVRVKGILRDRTGFIAMIQGADNKTYVVKAGDRLMDGSVKAIVAEAVVFSQDVNDPLSLVKQKEIRKTLRSTEEKRG
jgi:type IV pilus assembly protein PilP